MRSDYAPPLRTPKTVVVGQEVTGLQVRSATTHLKTTTNGRNSLEINSRAPKHTDFAHGSAVVDEMITIEFELRWPDYLPKLSWISNEEGNRAREHAWRALENDPPRRTAEPLLSLPPHRLGRSLAPNTGVVPEVHGSKDPWHHACHTSQRGSGTELCLLLSDSCQQLRDDRTLDPQTVLGFVEDD